METAWESRRRASPPAGRVSQAHIVNGCETNKRAYNVLLPMGWHESYVTGNAATDSCRRTRFRTRP